MKTIAYLFSQMIYYFKNGRFNNKSKQHSIYKNFLTGLSFINQKGQRARKIDFNIEQFNF